MADGLLDDVEMDVDKDAYRHVKRDWVTLLAPSLIAAVLSAGTSVLACSYFMGGLTQRVSTLETATQQIQHDYMPKEQILRFMDEQEKNTTRIMTTMDRMEDRQERDIEAARR